ncbi:MAG: sugar phosphate isomerase/epimerase family protein [Planctomycetota bacterium]
MPHRRHFLAATAAASTASLLPPTLASADDGKPVLFDCSFALNTSTIRGQKLSIEQQIDVTAESGYDGIEPWLRDIDKFVEGGGRLEDLRKRLDDAGLVVCSAIGFANWIAEDEAKRKAGLEQARKDMDRIAALGGAHLAAPPIGAHRGDGDKPALDAIAERYRELCKIGAEVGVKPQLELWGFSPTLSKLGELAYVATEAHHEFACVLPDFYHIYKGGNDFAGLSMIEASKIHCFHINDYPADPPREQIADKHRVFPGDGVCDLPAIIASLFANGFRGTFSLELFNPEYWKRDAAEVAKEGLEKSRSVVEAALNSVVNG